MELRDLLRKVKPGGLSLVGLHVRPLTGCVRSAGNPLLLFVPVVEKICDMRVGVLNVKHHAAFLFME